MKKETRANLIFIVILVVLLLPGAMILVNKKMQPGEKGLFYLPTARPHQAAYNDPLHKPGDQRVVPPEAIRWLDEVTASQTRESAKTFRGNISEKRVFELLTINQSDKSITRESVPFLMTAHWQTEATPELSSCLLVMRIQESASATPQAFELRPISTRAVAVPESVLEALRDLHYVVPPRQIVLVTWHWPSDEAKDLTAFDPETWQSIQLQTDDGQVVDQISWDQG